MSDRETDTEIDIELNREIDVLAVRRDAELLDLLASRGGLPASLAADPVARLLAALAADVDEGLGPPESPFGRLAAGAEGATAGAGAGAPAAGARRRRRHGTRTMIGMGVAGAVLSASGVAAAVTGDPLAPLRAVVTTVTDLKPGGKATPDQVAADLDRASEAIDAGNAELAMKKLKEARKKAAKLKGDDAVLALKQVAEMEFLLAAKLPPSVPGAPAVPGLPPSGATPTGTPTPKTAKELRQEQRRKEREERERKNEERRQEKQQQQKEDKPQEQPGQNTKQNLTGTPSPTLPPPTPSANQQLDATMNGSPDGSLTGSVNGSGG